MPEDFNISPEQMDNFITSVKMLNSAINNIAGQFGPQPKKFQTVQPQGVRSEEELEGQGEIGALEAKRKDAQYSNIAARKAADVIRQLTEKTLEQKTAIIENALKIESEQAEKIAQTPITADMNKAIMDSFKSQLQKTGTGTFTNILTEIEESGIRQLRFGELPMQDILRSAGTLASRYSTYRLGRSAARGEAGGGGGLGGLFTRGLGGLGTFLSGAGSVVGIADVVGDLAKSYYDKGIGEYRNLTSSGQLTGQGTMAGFQAKYLDPLALFNPFGRIGFGTAQEIVQQTREQGFTGPTAGRMEQGLANVVSNLGIQVGQATEFFTQSMREGGMSVGQVVQEMNKFHDATFNLNMNINDYTQQIMQASETLRDSGAGMAAPGLAQNITAALPRAFRNQEGTSFITEAFNRARGVIAGMVGHGANVLNISSQRYAKPGYSALDTVLSQQIQMARDQGMTSNNDIANYLTQVSPYFKGAPVPLLQQYINRVEHGRGLGAQITLSHAAQDYAERFSKARRETLRYNQMTPEELRAHNLQALYWRPGGKNRYSTEATSGQHAIAYENISTGRRYNPTDFRSIITDKYNVKEADKAKNELIKEVTRQHLLTKSQIEELKQAKPLDVQQTLADISQKTRGPAVNLSTKIGTVTIELAKNAQGVFSLNAERNRAVATANFPTNQIGK